MTETPAGKDHLYFFPEAGKTITIGKGGEFLQKNTYGFEIEFCSHDSCVFAFTHIEVLSLQLHGIEATPVRWHVETDSGNVLELVTRPLRFSTVTAAYEFKAALANMLTASTSPDSMTDGGITFEKWESLGVSDDIAKLLNDFRCAGKLQCHGPEIRAVQFERSSWQTIKNGLTLENVDDGINIPAALLRHRMYESKWGKYVNKVILSRSEKDWDKGYSSQANIPMTLPGYFLYSRLKTMASHNKYKSFTEGQINNSVTGAKIEKDINTWFWRMLTWRVLQSYVGGIHGPKILDQPNQWRLDDVKSFGMLYIMIQKFLTGAFGSFSEPRQLALQERAWSCRSTQGMVIESPDEAKILGEDVTLATLSWLEYHSALKDLTGLWFKASLQEVLAKQAQSSTWFKSVAKLISESGGRHWKEGFKFMLAQESTIYSRITDQEREYYTDLDRDWSPIISRIISIEKLFAEYLTDQELDKPGSKKADSFRSSYALPDPADRKFLHYKSAPPWEGRFDTMYPSFPCPDPEGCDQTTYLVEHRFN